MKNLQKALEENGLSWKIWRKDTNPWENISLEKYQQLIEPKQEKETKFDGYLYKKVMEDFFNLIGKLEVDNAKLFSKSLTGENEAIENYELFSFFSFSYLDSIHSEDSRVLFFWNEEMLLDPSEEILKKRLRVASSVFPEYAVKKIFQPEQTEKRLKERMVEEKNRLQKNTGLKVEELLIGKIVPAILQDFKEYTNQR